MIPMLTTTSVVMCPHGGLAQLFSSQSDALVDGAPVLLQTDMHPVVGCPFVPVAPSPCVLIQWASGATQTAIHGTPVLLQNSVGLCLNAAGAPQGPAVVAFTQQKAKGI